MDFCNASMAGSNKGFSMDACTDFVVFKNNHKEKKTQLLWRWIDGDLETPVSAYLKLCKNEKHCFLLESVEGGRTLGRYSIIGMEPDLIWRCNDYRSETWHDYGSWEMENAPPLEALRTHVRNCRIDRIPEGLPPMAVSGLFGYLGYDMIRLYEDIPDTNPDTLGIPQSILLRPTVLVIFDNVMNRICLVTPIYKHQGNSKSSAQKLYNEAERKLQKTVTALGKPIQKSLLKSASKIQRPLKILSNTSKTKYKNAVKKAIEYIHAGDIFQVVPSQRFEADFDLPSFHLYRALRRLNPSPFMFYLNFDGFEIIGSSPEILVRVRDNTVTIRPIAGTRQRGETPEQDKTHAESLLADEKERAEHLMLLDLGRNDVGRVSEYGSVKVTEQFQIEKYSHVMHIVSNVEGELKSDHDLVDALFAGFPAGTVSGAPKIRAMQIIDELELASRSYYAGCVGYLSGNGTLDTAIALRTAVVKDKKLYVQAGGGVVADSDPESEFQETVHKAKAIFTAAEDAIKRSE